MLTIKRIKKLVEYVDSTENNLVLTKEDKNFLKKLKPFNDELMKISYEKRVQVLEKWLYDQSLDKLIEDRTKIIDLILN